MCKIFGMSACVRNTILAVALPFAMTGVSLAATQESTIFSYDGQDFVRVKTSLTADDGKSAVNTKLDRTSPAFKALAKKVSYSGPTTLFGKKCDANYAPLVNQKGDLTGALFVASCGE